MDVLKVKERKRAMEIEIRDSAFKAVESFRRDTGMCPSSVSIEMQESTTIGDGFRRYVVCDAECSVVI